jgi:hypothetical protein
MRIDIFFRSSKHKKESSVSTERSASSISNQARVSGTNSPHESAPGGTSPKIAQAWASVSSAKSKPIHSNLIPIAADEDINFQHYNVQIYAEQVINGISSLGIDTPPYLQQALVDQHGVSTTREYSYSTVVRGMELSAGSQYLDLGPTTQQDQWPSTYVNNDGYSNGDLAGIGARFHS